MGAENGHLEIVTYLIQSGANIPANHWGATKLSAAVRSGNLEIVKFLIKSIDGIQDATSYPLESAAAGHLEIVKFLIQCSAYPDLDLALEWCASPGHLVKEKSGAFLEVFKFLVQSGADIHNERIPGCTAEGGNMEIFKFLIQSGVDIRAKNDRALRYSALSENLDIAKFLIRSGCDISAKDDWALKWNSKHGKLKNVKFYLN